MRRGRSGAPNGRRSRPGPWRAARGSAGPRRPSRPSRWSSRCRPRPAASAGRRPSSPGTATLATPGSLLGRVGGAVHAPRPATAAATAADQAGAQRPQPRPARGPAGSTATSTAAANPATAATSRVPGADVALLTAAVLHRGQVDLAPGQQRADPVRAAELVRGEGHQVQPAGGEVDRRRDRPPARRRCATARRARRPGAATAATGCRVPTSLLAHITETSGGARADRRRRGRLASTRPVASTGSQCDRRAPAAWPASRPSRARRGARPRGDHLGAPAARPGDQYPPLTARLSDSVPPEVKITSRRVGADGGGDRLAGLLDHPAGRPARAVQRRRRCRSGPARGSSPRPPRAPSAWSPRGRGRSGSWPQSPASRPRSRVRRPSALALP